MYAQLSFDDLVSVKTCSVDGCDKPPRSSGTRHGVLICKMHYHRQYRHGSVDAVATNLRTGPGRRYRRVYLPNHPLRNKYGQVYVHRQVLYDTIGPGPHECHWCGALVNWAAKGAPDELQPDHVNGLGDDNRPENLVPACRACNTTRGVQARSERLKEMGFFSNHDTVAVLGTRKPPIS
jgi:5-methylcytosine-specific restriction endonuclease McrA